jgi:hypothetical protein
MHAGRLKYRITIRRIVEGKSAGHAAIETPVVVAANVPARKIEGPGTSRFLEEQRVEWAAVVWECRYFLLDETDEPTSKFDIVHEGRVYEVLDKPQEIGWREGWRFITRARAEDQRVVA